MPSVLQMLSARAQAQAQAPVTTNGQATATQTAAPPAHSPTPANAQTALSADPMTAYQELFNGKLLPSLERNLPVREAAAAVNGFLLRFPQFEQTLFGFLEMETAQLLAAIGQVPGAAHLPKLPHAAQWLDALRAEIFTDEDAPESGADNAP